MRTARLALVFGLSLTLPLAACQQADPVEQAHAGDIAWREGDVEDALAEAKEQGKPVLLYWGAVWCPPCNYMKTTLFKQPGFIAETENFVPVYLDGDTEGAQRWGETFGISGYPTVIVLQPDGTEITRISSSTMADELPELLALAAGRTTSLDALLAKAEADTAGLTAEDWQILAGYDWLNDPKRYDDLAQAGALLTRLGEEAPDPATRRSLSLLALYVTADEAGDEGVDLSPAQEATLLQVMPAILASRQETTANRQLLAYSAGELVAAIGDKGKRADLGEKLLAAMDALYADEAIPTSDRLDTIYPALALVGDKVPDDLKAKVRSRVAWADKTATDEMVRASLMPTAADLLYKIGDGDAAIALLEGELDNARTPFYYMSDIASIEEDMGHADKAIEWRRKAYEASQGPATRVQWAIAWSNAVIRLKPEDRQAVEESADVVLAELGKSPDSYYMRTRQGLTSWGNRLRAWSETHGGGPVLEDLRTQMADICARQGEQAQACNSWSRSA